MIFGKMCLKFSPCFPRYYKLNNRLTEKTFGRLSNNVNNPRLYLLYESGVYINGKQLLCVACLFPASGSIMLPLLKVKHKLPPQSSEPINLFSVTLTVMSCFLDIIDSILFTCSASIWTGVYHRPLLSLLQPTGPDSLSSAWQRGSH